MKWHDSSALAIFVEHLVTLFDGDLVDLDGAAVVAGHQNLCADKLTCGTLENKRYKRNSLEETTHVHSKETGRSFRKKHAQISQKIIRIRRVLSSKVAKKPRKISPENDFYPISYRTNL